MKIFKDPKFQFFSLLLIFFILNFLQSYITLLFEDEAYYYVWSKDLALGYFDHPPMVALWAAFGQLFFEGELGVRLLSSLSFSMMIWLIWEMIDFKEKWNHIFLFFILIISLAFWQVFGFIMTPDTPLLLFTAVFMLAYKRFLNNDSLFNSLFLGFAMAGMLYSKYHGILVIIFVVLSNLKLFKNPRFWLASVFGFVLFVPHLFWQFENGFPSFLYHLKERNKKPYHIGKTLLHFVNMIAIVGITFPVIYSAFFKHKASNLFERSLKYIVYGFFVFFLISTFSSEPQAQWVIVVSIPLVIISFPYLVIQLKARRWLFVLGSIQLVILLSARALFAFPSISPIPLEPHLSTQWVPELYKNTEGRPLIFVNNYSEASLYNFYTGVQTHSYSILKGRKSQYDLLDFEENMQGMNVYSVSKYESDLPEIASRTGRIYYGKAIDNYYTFEKVKCEISGDEIHIVNGLNTIEFTLTNNYKRTIFFDNVDLVGVFQGSKNKILLKVPLNTEKLNPLEANEKKTIRADFYISEMPSSEKMTFRAGLDFYQLMEGFQGNKVKVVIKKN
ncbi:glycosyltransferase family 39 protein [Lutimonas saemankumensis]|uniref:ArnT family glycosyltransferase n=1 Tax=Lutimonas saemankumensis TaxID=483016 RepID=UPI001CD3789D|nr:glycosyltransferase family 39 protein [Lutimonas saemankumensis]MCA0932975.1 glycosyltransferase family 39 protein [Lutimonas saemankumensis]